jgi:hypothetical protein
MGAGPITKLFTQPGAFGGDLFVVSGRSLYRYDGETVTLIGSGLQEGVTQEMAVMSGIGYQILFIADGLNLYYYEGTSFATGELEATGAIADGDVIVINGTYYAWESGSVNTGTPDGTVGSPFLVALGGSNTDALQNMFDAINFTGTSGTTYSATLGGPNTSVVATSVDSSELQIRARLAGSDGNAITTTETGSNTQWNNGGTLTGGGLEGLGQVVTPDNTEIVSVASLGGLIIAVESNSNRFFWILPGETTINPLHFASAEQSPDEIVNAVVVGDRVWFLGEDTIESWYASGDPDIAFLPDQGLVFAQGAIPGTVVKVNEFAALVGTDGVVYSVGGGIQRISDHAIENQIRLALEEERAAA